MKTNRHLLRRIAGGLTALATAVLMFPASVLAVNTSEYTTPQYGQTSDGVTVEITKYFLDWVDWNLHVDVDVTIDENTTERELNANILGYFKEAVIFDNLQPGDGLVVSVNLINNSEINYTYKDNSIILGTDAYLPREGEENLDIVQAFDGFNVYLGSYNDVTRSYNTALDSILNIDEDVRPNGYSTYLTDESISKSLSANGYENGIEDLDDFYIDYYNDFYKQENQPSISDLQDADPLYIRDIFSCKCNRSGDKQHVNTKIRETNREVAALGYYYLYGCLLTYNGNSVSSYMENNSSSLKALNTEIKEGLSDFPIEKESTLEFYFELDGEYTRNCYQNHSVILNMALSFINPNEPEKPSEPSSEPSSELPSEPEEPPVVIPDDDPTISIRKVWVEDIEEDRPDSILVEIYHDEELYDTIEVEEKYRWRASYDIPERYENDDWWVQEADVPEGYEDYIDETRDNVFVITNTYVGVEEESSEESSEPSVLPSEPSVEPSEPSSEPVSEPEPAEPTLPQTGQVWWPVILLLAGGAVLVAFGAFRTIRGHGRRER